MKRYGLFTGKTYDDLAAARKSGECCVVLQEGSEEEIKKEYGNKKQCLYCSGGCSFK